MYWVVCIWFIIYCKYFCWKSIKIKIYICECIIIDKIWKYVNKISVVLKVKIEE